MADFCKACSIEIFGEDFGDMAGLCKEDELTRVLCEHCGFIQINSKGERVERHLCISEDPYDPTTGSKAIHPKAVEVGDYDDYVRYECPICKVSWKEELPG